MSQPDIILIIALAVIAGGIGYLLGTRSPKRVPAAPGPSAPPPAPGSDPASGSLKDPVVTPVVAKAVVSRPPPAPTAKEEPSHNDLVEAATSPNLPPVEEKKEAKKDEKKEEKKEPAAAKQPSELTSSHVVTKEKEPKKDVKATLPSATGSKAADSSKDVVPPAAKSDPKLAGAALVAAVKGASPKPAPAKPESKSGPIAKPQAPAPSKPKQSPAPPVAKTSSAAPAKKESLPAAKPTEGLLPKIDFEEDEDVEPTKVGEVTQVLQPPIMKIVFDPDSDSEEPVSQVPLFVISATAQTDPGLRRKRNEDNLLVLETANLFVVADGMGGHRGGQLASEIAVKKIGDAYRTGKFEGEQHDGIGKDGSELARAMQMANAAIFAEAKRHRELEGMGTTVCGARFSPNKRRMVIGHVGDSRCYRLRKGVLTIMTHDHTMADHGVTGPESANLSRAIGIWPTVPMDMILAMPEVGDVYLLCSDGLTKMLPDEQIATVLRSEEDPKAAVERLVFFANARGGKDNITVILLRVVATKPS